MIVVLADDFSGAAEIAGIAHRLGLEAVVQIDQFSRCDAQCIVVDSNTRNLTASEATVRVAEIARQVRAADVELLFKKVDSVLRGPIVEEARAIAAVFAKNQIIVANANPTLRRTVCNGRLKIGGVPVHQTVFAQDPEYPRTSDDVLALLGEPCAHEVPISVANASSTTDLDDVAASAGDDALLCGGSDFFEALLKRRGGVPAPQNGTCLALGAGTLIARGSSTGAPSPIVDVVRLDLANPQVSAATVIEHMREGACVEIAASTQNATATHDWRMDTIAAAVHAALASGEVRQLLIEGGRTASMIARTLGYSMLRVTQSFGVGVTGLEAIGAHPAVKIVVKPGSYAWPKVHRHTKRFSRPSARWDAASTYPVAAPDP